MLSEEEYYSYLYNHFIKKNEAMFAACDETNLISQPLPAVLFDELMTLLDTVCEKYGFNMQKMCQPNYNKFMLWQKNNSNVYSSDELLIATKFIVFCCLADKILDSPRFDKREKESVCRKLDVNNFIRQKPFVSGMFVEMDELINEIREFLLSERVKRTVHRNTIINKIHRAFKSEIYMYTNPLLPKEEFIDTQINLLTDKSVEFEIAAFLISSATTIHASSIYVATYIANIFWIIDDLCDLIDDIKCKRKNSILFYCLQGVGEISLTDRVEKSFRNIDFFIAMLEKNLSELKKCVDRDLYEYVLNEVWEWCSDVRKVSG